MSYYNPYPGQWVIWARLPSGLMKCIGNRDDYENAVKAALDWAKEQGFTQMRFGRVNQSRILFAYPLGKKVEHVQQSRT